MNVFLLVFPHIAESCYLGHCCIDSCYNRPQHCHSTAFTSWLWEIYNTSFNQTHQTANLLFYQPFYVLFFLLLNLKGRPYTLPSF